MMNHWVWDDDPDESLCGIDVTHKKWVEARVDCQNCILVNKFINLVEIFNKTFDIKDSVFAAAGVWKQADE